MTKTHHGFAGDEARGDQDGSVFDAELLGVVETLLSAARMVDQPADDTTDEDRKGSFRAAGTFRR
ncbi:MAG: hypothetical protein QM757_41340 [Paludibaculum sp.]